MYIKFGGAMPHKKRNPEFRYTHYICLWACNFWLAFYFNEKLIQTIPFLRIPLKKKRFKKHFMRKS
jgi:hypothetical protein